LRRDEGRCSRQLLRSLPRRFVDVDPEETTTALGALGLRRTISTAFQGGRVNMRSVQGIDAHIRQGFACRTEVAVGLFVIGELLDSVPIVLALRILLDAHVRGDLSLL
jgi:hypothetical protein